jgi:hypothetical protein
MNINRHNYEEFFILYLDKELSSEDRLQVELFVAANPDLKVELDLLLQSQLTPDAAVVFDNKEQLLRSSSNVDVIDHSNYEEWLMLYVDGELSVNQNIVVEKLVSNHPEIKAQLDILQKTKLQPDTAVVFANKEILYRSEERVRIIAINWKRIAVAAALLLAVSTTALILLNNKDNNQPDVALNPTKEQPNQSNSTPATQQPANEIASTNVTSSGKTSDAVGKNNVESSNTNVAVESKGKTDELKQKTVPEVLPVIKNDEPVLADNSQKKTNNLSQPTSNPYVNKVVEDNPIAMAEPSVKKSLTNLNETNNTSTVTLNNSDPLDNVRRASLTEPVDEEQPGRKNKLRGFFRKVTRTFEKNTNIKATDDEDRLLLGGLAIKL